MELDPGPPELCAQGLGQADDSVLGGAVGGAAGEPALAGNRGELDDVAPATGTEPGEPGEGAVPNPAEARA